MIVVYLCVLVGIVLYYILKPSPKRKREYRVTKAGDVEHISSLTRTINDLSNKSFMYGGKSIDIDNYEIFIVDGESMSKCGIHTGNGVLVSRLFDKTNVQSGSVIIYEINPDRYIFDHPEEDRRNEQYGFKIRQFLGYADLSQDNKAICEQLINVDNSLANSEHASILFRKLDKARRYYHPSTKVTISITYKKEYKDYSVHSLSELYGIVSYIIPSDMIKSM